MVRSTMKWLVPHSEMIRKNIVKNCLESK